MDVSSAFGAAFSLIISLDPQFMQIVGLSLRVTLTAVLLAALIGLPLGALLAVTRFPGRSAIVVLVNGLMGLPPVVAGLIVFLLLSRSGPLGGLGWLFSPTAMVIARRTSATDWATVVGPVELEHACGRPLRRRPQSPLDRVRGAAERFGDQFVVKTRTCGVGHGGLPSAALSRPLWGES